ncbi:MAG: hypothetical protein R6V57_04530 [Vicinamibacterales bacterium]
MRVPLTWLRDYVAITDTPEELASRLTFAGLEVEDIEYVGLAPASQPVAGLPAAGRSGPHARGLVWDPATIVIARILEVMPHPNADRLHRGPFVRGRLVGLEHDDQGAGPQGPAGR